MIGYTTLASGYICLSYVKIEQAWPDEVHKKGVVTWREEIKLIIT